MNPDSQDGRIGRLTFAVLALLVVAFMALSLLVTATGTARFAVAMAYHANAGYAVGAIFDIAKGMLPVALLALLARRALVPQHSLALLGFVSSSSAASQRTPQSARPSQPSSAPASGRWRCAGTPRPS